MTEQEQLAHFANELDKLVERFRSEYDLTYGSLVGALHMRAHLLCSEAEKGENESGD